jgi:transcription factor SFP1
MMGTSPTAFHHSSSFQSSSYMPKMEASLLKDFYCCGENHLTYHDFVNHTESHHKDLPSSYGNPSAMAGFKARSVSGSAQSIPRTTSTINPSSRSQLETIQDDTMGEMELDDNHIPTTFSMFGSNPTVSSVNTPNLSTQPFHESQLPISPLTANFSGLTFDNQLNELTMNDSLGGLDLGDFNSNYGLGGGTIHDPANLLSSRNNPLDAAQLQFGLNTNDQVSMEFQRSLQRQQIAAGIPLAGVIGFPGQEEKKYRCPVIGCEKSYKNQNGLKYHKSVSIFLVRLKLPNILSSMATKIRN